MRLTSNFRHRRARPGGTMTAQETGSKSGCDEPLAEKSALHWDEPSGGEMVELVVLAIQSSFHWGKPSGDAAQSPDSVESAAVDVAAFARTRVSRTLASAATRKRSLHEVVEA